MARKPRAGEQLATGNIGKIKDVGADRLRPGIVSAGNLAPPSSGSGGASGSSSSLYGTATPSQIDVGDSGVVGVDAGLSRDDHQHALPSPGTPPQIDIGDAAAAGASTKVAREDHQHALPVPGVPTDSAPGDVASAGTSTKVTREDHRHGRESTGAGFPGFGTDPAQIDVGDAQVGGVSATASHSDHQHALLAPGAPTVINSGDAANGGASLKVAREDHVHGVTSGFFDGEQKFNTAGQNGTSTRLAKDDHRHGNPAIRSNGTPMAARSSLNFRTGFTVTDNGGGVDDTTVDVSIGGAAVPIGGIIMWGGLLASIPAGYSLCDGTGGTPDLRSRMIRGNRAGVDPGGPFGSDTHGHTAHSNHTVTQPAAHSNHVVTQPNNHVVTQPSAHADHDSQGAHNHDSHSQSNAIIVGVALQPFLNGPITHTSGGAHTHNAHSAHVGTAVDSHTGTSVDAHSVHTGTAVDAHSAHSTESNLPVYYELAFIQRTS